MHDLESVDKVTVLSDEVRNLRLALDETLRRERQVGSHFDISPLQLKNKMLL